MLPPWNCCSDRANLSAHLHRLPTPPPYLRRMRLLHGWVRRYPMGGKAVAWPGCRRWALDEAVSRLGCRKATLQLPDANYLSSQCQSQSFRAQKRDFCALLPSGTPVFMPFEHKIGIFVRFWGLEALFSGFSSTKSRFLCAFGVQNPRFQAFRAQNRGFCALLGFGSPDFKRFEHKIGVFVRF